MPCRVEVFDIFRNMSSDMDSEDKPFSLEIVKGFMETVTNLGTTSDIVCQFSIISYILLKSRKCRVLRAESVRQIFPEEA